MSLFTTSLVAGLKGAVSQPLSNPDKWEMFVQEPVLHAHAEYHHVVVKNRAMFMRHYRYLFLKIKAQLL